MPTPGEPTPSQTMTAAGVLMVENERLSARVAQLDTECQAAANLIGSQAARIARLEAALRKIRGHDRMCSDFQAAEDMTSIARQALRESQP